MAFNNINPIAIDLFCGAGGLSLGLEQSNITVPLGVEINAIAAQTYTNNLNGNVLQDDIRNTRTAQSSSWRTFLIGWLPTMPDFLFASKR